MTETEHQRWMRDAMLVLALYLGALATGSKDGLQKALEGTEILAERQKNDITEG